MSALPDEKSSPPETTRDSTDQSLKPDVVTQAPGPQPIVIPDGGLRAWLTVLGGWLVMFCAFGYSNSFGVYQSYYALHSHSSSSDISWIGSLQLFLTFSMSLPVGKLVDLGYFHHVVFTGSLLFVFSLFMLSLANPHHYYELILAQGVGMGLGSGMLLVSAQSVQGHHFRKRRAMALGIVFSGTGLGGVIYPIMLNRLFNGSAGFAWGVRASAFLSLGLLVIANCIMSTRLPSAKNRPPGPKLTLKPIVTDPAYLTLVAGTFLAIWGGFFPYFYLQLWVNLHRLSNTLAFYTIAILNAASIPGRIVLNMLADRIGPFNVLVPVITILGALIFAMFGVTSTGAVVVFAILYGFFSGAYIALLAPTLASTASDVSELGVRLGLAYFVASFAFLTGTPISGALLGSGVHWYKPIIFSAVVLLAGSGIVGVARMMYSSRRGTQRL